MKPVGTNIILKGITQDLNRKEKKKVDIILPDRTDKEIPELGEVVSIGVDVKEIKKGDKILFNKFTPKDFKHKGKDYLVIEETDVLVIL